MATLLSEDNESPSALTLGRGEVEDQFGQTWEHFSITLKSGEFRLNLGTNRSDACLLCRKPDDEVAALCLALQDLLDGKSEHVLFEPAEPSFELSVTRRGKLGLKVEVWLDAGNAKTGIYSWDAAGIRFFTQQDHLADFLQQVRHEFNC